MRYPSLVLLMVLFVCGCANYQQNLKQFNTLYYEQNQEKAYEFSKKLAKNSLLWQIQNGISAYTVGKYIESLQILDKAEATINKNQSNGFFANSLSNVGATLINDNVKDYEGSVYEGILVNYYKALDALLIDDSSRARIEFNRANDRQRRAREYYQKEIKKAIEAQKNEKSDSSEIANKNTSEERIDSILNSQYSNLKLFQAYDGFVNPLVSYVSGLYFSLQGDPKGIDLLKESYGINKANIIGNDIVWFQNRQLPAKKYTWIIIEDGMAPTKKEIKIEFPLFLLSDSTYYFGMSLPQLDDGISFYNSFSLEGKSITKFEQISLTDGVIANEFSKQLPYILTRAIISAVYKTVAQNVLNENVGGLAGLGAAIFAAATNSADTRITTVFPHNVWLDKIENQVGSVTLKGDGKNLLELDFINCDAKDDSSQTNTQKICINSNNIVYIKTTKNNIISKLLIGEKK